MTYVYRFTLKENGIVYVGQHRMNSYGKDPLKDAYKGSGTEWTSIIKEKGLWKIADFRLSVNKEILQTWDEDVDIKEVNKAEVYWIEETKKLFGDKCINKNKGGGNSYKIKSAKEAKQKNIEAQKRWQKSENGKKYSEKYRSTEKWHVIDNEAQKRWYHNHPEDKVAANKKYRKNNPEYDKSPERKLYFKAWGWGNRHQWVSPEEAVFPETWEQEVVSEYIKQWTKRSSEKNR